MTLAILSWLKSRGIPVAPFKVGPDFIDPGHHTRAAGRTCYNLDSWMLPRAYNKGLFERAAQGAKLAVVEGVMGLFDGYDALTETGSTAQMAKWLNLPVILIVSAKGKARSAAAVVKGFETFDPDLNLAGVIFTKTGSQRHYDYLRGAVEQNCTTPCLGHFPKQEGITMPERHLGLMTVEEHELDPHVAELLVQMVDEHLDMDRLMDGLPDYPLPVSPAPPLDIPLINKVGPVIGVPRDKAFCFYYPDNLEILEQLGAKLQFFSPLTDEQLPPGLDGIYLGGGYPEVHGDILAKNRSLRDEILRMSRAGMPIYGECGGFMYLCESLLPALDGEAAPMTGCFDFKVNMGHRLRSLGYREVTFTRDTPLGPAGTRVRGHEFHYSALENPSPPPGVERVYQVTSRAGQDVKVDGYQIHNTLGSYLHIHFGANPETARCFVESCLEFRSRGKVE
ncbi:MAG: cobyrinate a,c-diamide synthase [Desulfobacterales bacterium]|nr:cobyrinate a,c-diamide synthase [Desulfobacterales bacterium]